MISTKYPIYATFYARIQRSQMCYSGLCEGYLGDHSDPDDNCTTVVFRVTGLTRETVWMTRETVWVTRVIRVPQIRNIT